MSMISIEIKPFGIFRNFGIVQCVVEAGSDTFKLKAALVEKLGLAQHQLVMDSVLADDDKILPANAVFNESMSLSILPPVCGG